MTESHGAATTLRRWSTSAVPPRQRLDYWIGAICEGFLEMDATSPCAMAFDSELVSAALGPIGLNRVRGSAQDVYRSRSAIARARENYYYLLCKADAPWVAGQDGHAARLMPGDLVLVDSRRCYEFHFAASADTLSLQLPTAWVEQWVAGADQAQQPLRIDGSSGWGQALSVFVRMLQPELAHSPPLPAALMVDQLGAMLSLACGREPAATPRDHAVTLRQRVLDEVRARHAEPGLTAATVAGALGISERSLHRSLAGGATTFAGALADCRMAAARRMLADPRFDRFTVAEIGRRVGLADASHFVRQCKQHLGATPAAWRQRR